MILMFSSATAAETGWPPNVEPWANIDAFSLSVEEILSLTTTPPMGR